MWSRSKYEADHKGGGSGHRSLALAARVSVSDCKMSARKSQIFSSLQKQKEAGLFCCVCSFQLCSSRLSYLANKISTISYPRPKWIQKRSKLVGLFRCHQRNGAVVFITSGVLLFLFLCVFVYRSPSFFFVSCRPCRSGGGGTFCWGLHSLGFCSTYGRGPIMLILGECGKRSG
jgi:hypothetical protein